MQRLGRNLGRLLTGLVATALAVTAAHKLLHLPAVIAQFDRLGFGPDALPWLAACQLFGAALLLHPRTAVLGAVWLTAYLGGATAAVRRVGDPPVVSVGLAVLACAGELLRRPVSVHALTPLPRAPTAA